MNKRNFRRELNWGSYVKSKFVFIVSIGLFLICSCTQSPTSAQNKLKEPSNENIKTPKLEGKQKMSGATNYPMVDKETGVKELESFIFDLHYGRKVEPKNLDPAHAEEFIIKRLDRTRKADSFARARLVADFYDLSSVVGHFSNQLQRNEKDAAGLLQSVEMIRILGEMGDVDNRKAAVDYFQYLAKSPLAESEFEALTEAIDSFYGPFSPETISVEMNKTFSELKERGKTDPFVDGQAEELFILMKSRLPQLLAHLKIRNDIAGIPEADLKIKKLCDIYLSQADVTSPELERWAARLLRKAAAEGQIKLITTSMRLTNKMLEEAGYEEDEKRSYQIRIARAIRFFGEKLTDTEQELIKQADRFQVDILDRDFYEGEV